MDIIYNCVQSVAAVEHGRRVQQGVPPAEERGGGGLPGADAHPQTPTVRLGNIPPKASRH